MLIVSLVAGLAFLLIGTGPNVQGPMNVQKTAQLVAQAQLILHRITKCATDYPDGNNGTGLHKAYPAGSSKWVADLTCPNNSDPSLWLHLWSGVDGVYPPAAIAGFGAWAYTNASPAIIFITATQPAAYSSALDSAATKIGPAASATADTLTVRVIE